MAADRYREIGSFTPDKVIWEGVEPIGGLAVILVWENLAKPGARVLVIGGTGYTNCGPPNEEEWPFTGNDYY